MEDENFTLNGRVITRSDPLEPVLISLLRYLQQQQQQKQQL